MKKFILYLWQLPQNILGLLIILFTNSKMNEGHEYWYTKKFNFGISLGNYIIFGNKNQLIYDNDVKHEKGHQKQSLYLGWFYLLIIGLPSISFNIFDIFFHNNWTNKQRLMWYYNLPWEHWADKLGKVDRNY